MPNELLFRVVLHGGVLPGAVAFFVLGALWWRSGRRTEPGSPSGEARGPRWALPLLMTMGFCASFWVVEQSIELWPAANTRRLYHAALLVGVAGVLEGSVRLPWIATLLARAAAFAGVTWMLTEGYSPNVLTPAQLWLLVAGAALASAGVAAAADAGLSRTRGWTGPLAALAVLGPAQPFLHLAGYSSGSIALTGAVAALSSALLVSVVCRGFSMGAGDATALVGLVLIALLGAGVQTEPKSVPALVLVAATPLALWIRAGGPLVTLAVRGAVASALVGAAIGLVALANKADRADDPYADYYGLLHFGEKQFHSAGVRLFV